LRAIEHQRSAAWVAAAQAMVEKQRGNIRAWAASPEEYYQSSLRLLQAERDQGGGADDLAALVLQRQVELA
jgi:hypothetical protein